MIALLDQRAAELARRIATLEQMRRDLVALVKQARRFPPVEEAQFCHIIEGASRRRPACP